MRLGYFRAEPERVSKEDLQSLEGASCDQIVIDTVAGGRSNVLAAKLEDLKAGDTLVVVRLGHLMHMPALLGLLADLVDRGIEVQSIADRVRTTDPGVAATLLSLSRYLIKTHAAIPARKGRPPAIKPADLERARQMIFEENQPLSQVANELGVSRSTLYRHLPAA